MEKITRKENMDKLKYGRKYGKGNMHNIRVKNGGFSRRKRLLSSEG